MQMAKHYLIFKLILAYIKHSFRCSINETVNHINLVLLITCSTNNGKIGHSGEFYSVTMITLHMIISKETGQLLLQYQFEKNFISQIKSGEIRPSDIKVIVR